MRKDQTQNFRDWIQFQSNKITDISLFMEMKHVWSNDKPAMETVKRSSKCNWCCHIQSVWAEHKRWADTYMSAIYSQWLRHKGSCRCISFTERCFLHRLQELIYTADVIAGARLIFSSFHYTFLSCSQIGWVEICQENHKMFFLRASVPSTGWQLTVAGDI